MKKYLMATLAVLALAFAAPMSAADETELTVTGTVVSSTADSVVVRTPEGEKTFVINMLTDEPDELAANSQVTIRYHEEDGRLVAKAITMGSSSATTDTSASTTTTPPATVTGETTTTDTSASASASATYSDPSATTTTQESSRTDVDVTNVQDDTDYDDTSMAAAETDTASAEALPATATKLPLLALIGLVLLAAGLAIRIAR